MLIRTHSPTAVLAPTLPGLRVQYAEVVHTAQDFQRGPTYTHALTDPSGAATTGRRRHVQPPYEFFSWPRDSQGYDPILIEIANQTQLQGNVSSSTQTQGCFSGSTNINQTQDVLSTQTVTQDCSSTTQTQDCSSTNSTNKTQDSICSSTMTVPISVGLGIGVPFTIASITLGYLYLQERKRRKARELSSGLQHLETREINHRRQNLPSQIYSSDGGPILRELPGVSLYQ
ncbi:hypothetical protein V8E54_003222 [Elaphomyces granulatus]|jgi:hypothetical protein